MAKNSSVMERRIVAYLDKDLYDKIAPVTVKNRSKTIGRRIIEYYKSLPPQEQDNLMRLYDEMTEDQRKKPRS